MKPSKPPPRINYDDYISTEARGRVRNPLKSLRPYTEVPGMISVRVSQVPNAHRATPVP